MRYLHLLSFTLIVLAFGVPAALAEKRVALVVGNGAYEHTAALANPVNDAKDMAAALRALGFEVFEGLDLTEADFARKVRDFARAARGADAALFYYAGHGLQVEGRNYLVPVDARLSDEADLRFEALELSDVVELMERASPASLVFLDACRDNPLAQGLARSLGASRSTSVGRGLARLDSGVGTLIAYATQPGAVAADGRGRNSPFTAALVEHLATPGLEVNQLLNRVRQTVVAATDQKQIPWTHSSLTGDFYLSPPERSELAATEHDQPAPASDASAVIQAPSGFDERQLELEFWQSVKESEDWQDFQAYLDHYGADGTFTELAERRRDVIKSREAQQQIAGSTQPGEGESDELAALPREWTEASAKAAEQDLKLTRNDRQLVQQALNEEGYKAGTVDGVFGQKTRTALSDWQVANGLVRTGYLTPDQAEELLAIGNRFARLAANALSKKHIVKAKSYLKYKLYDQALAEFDKAVRSDPQYTEAYIQRGLLYIDKPNLHRAIEDFNSALRLDPRHVKAHHYRGDTHCKIGNSKSAKEDYLRVVQYGSKRDKRILRGRIKRAGLVTVGPLDDDPALRVAIEEHVNAACL